MGIQSIIPKTKTQDTIVFNYSLFTNEDKLILAPMQNLTSLFFRKTFSAFFPQNIDYAVSPFISVSANNQNAGSVQYKDISPVENKNLMPVIPQVLGNKAAEILECAKIIEHLGYREININMGCPKKDIVSHKRGSGLLKEKETVRQIFETILNNTHLQISVKVRLGINDSSDLDKLVDLFNSYPLKSVCIHPRTQIQQYSGEPDYAAFEYFASKIKHTIIYNGDIYSCDDFKRLKSRFPYIKHWMTGRGLLQNPFLCADIKGIPYNKQQTLPAYMNALQENFTQSLHRYNEISILSSL